MNSLQKRGYTGIRQKQLNFRCRSLVQFKVTWKYDFLKCQKLFLYLFEMNSLQKLQKLDRNSWINYLKNEHWYLHFVGIFQTLMIFNIHFVKKQFLCQTCNSASISKISIKTSKEWTLMFSLCGYQKHDFEYSFWEETVSMSDW